MGKERFPFLTDYLIVGAGVSGLLVARELLAAGATVCLIDRNEAGREASWAGGGIVSPLYPWRYSEAVTALACRAQDIYPRLAADLLNETGIDPQYRECGLLMLEAPDRQQALDWSSRYLRPVQLWDEQRIYAHEKVLAPGSVSALWMPSVANVRNPRLLQALRASVISSNAAILKEHCELLSLNSSDTHAISACVRQNGVVSQISSGSVIVTAGAWTGQLIAGLQTDIGMGAAEPRVQVAPVKGEMLLYRTDRKLLNGIVLSNGRYLIPREDNLILAGSTLEYSDFDKTITEQARSSLVASAVSMVPALAESTIVAQWAGLRPGSPAGVPYIGRVQGLDNVFVNAGHFRNGLVLAPASAKLLADIVLGRVPDIDPTPYDPTRQRESAGFGS